MTNGEFIGSLSLFLFPNNRELIIKLQDGNKEIISDALVMDALITAPIYILKTEYTTKECSAVAFSILIGPEY